MILVPSEMPVTGAAQQEFEPDRVDYQAPEAGGRTGGVQAGFPRWTATWQIGRIGAERSDLWRDWLLGQRGGQRRFFARDLARPFPKRHIGGFLGMTKVDGSPFLGGASGWSQAITGDGDAMLTLQGLPAGLILSLGDYADFRWDDPEGPAGNDWRRALVRVRSTAAGASWTMADAAGTVTVRIEPPVPALVPAQAAAHLDRPACMMKLDMTRTKLNAIDRRLAVTGGTVAGAEDLRP